jgi:hypothetical protein
VEVVLASVAEGNFGLATIDALAGPVAVAVAVPPDMLRTIRVAAALTTSIQGVGAIIPTAKPLFIIAPLCFLTSLDFGGLGCLYLKLVAVSRPAQPAHRCFRVTVPGTEVAATDDTLSRRVTETYRNWTFAA